MNIFGNCHFHARAIARTRKVWFHLSMSRILFDSQTKLDDIEHAGTPLFVGIFCRSRDELSANEKEEKFATKSTTLGQLSFF